MKIDTTSATFFEQKYRDAADPWHFASSNYEQQRYAAILNALSHRRYSHAFEPGCSIGILTAGLAPMCERVDAIDISPTAVRHAKEHCRKFPNVHISSGSLASVIPDGSFDLLVLSEIGYYFEAEELRKVANTLIDRTVKSGIILAAHWLGKSPDHLLGGDLVHEILGSLDRLTHEHSERHTGFRLDRWSRI